MQKLKISGIVIKSLNYKDADKIYTILTRENGKISAIAKGVRKISSKRAGNLDTLNLINFTVNESQNGIYYIEEVKTILAFKNIKNSLENLEDVFYILELFHKSLGENQGGGEVFGLLLESLRILDKYPEHKQKMINRLELLFMKHIGYEMNLKKCVKCGRNIKDNWFKYNFNIDQGGFICENCNLFGTPIEKESVLCLIDLDKGLLPKNYSDEVFKEVNFLLKTFVRYHLGDKFKSLELKLG